jgi:Glycosyl-4,4'-diaponeurosporenoate acyltransferase
VQKLRSVFAVTGTAIAFAVSFVMLAQVIGFTSPWLALLLMFNFMGLAKIAEPIFMFRLPSTLSKIRPWEEAGSMYRRLGVQRFGEILRNSPHRHLNPAVYLSPGPPDLRALYRRAASAEATHFYAAVAFSPYIGYLCLSGQFSMGTFFLAVQLLFNVYPILNLRVLRSRLEEVLRRRHRRVRRSRAAPPHLER